MLTSVRDFLLLFFFLDLGAQLDLGLLGAQLVESLVFSLFVLIGNPLIVMVIMGVLGYRSRTGFLAGLTVAQISEFSLILGALGLSLGHISAETMGLITLVGLITISASTYMIVYSHPLYERLAPWLGVFERRQPHREAVQDSVPDDAVPLVVLFGLGRYGNGIARTLRERGWRVLGVDFNPDLVRAGDATGHPVMFGDAEDPEYIATLPLGRTHWVVSTARERHVNLSLVHSLRSRGYSGRIAITAQAPDDAARLEHAGADLILVPYADAAREAADRIMSPEFCAATVTGGSMTLNRERDMKQTDQGIDWSTVVSRALLFSLLWWALTDGTAGSWWIGVPAVACAVIVSVALVPPVGLVWREVMGFVPFFLWHSLKGGADVAWRAFHPRLPITPELIEYPLRLPPGLPQVILVNIDELAAGHAKRGDWVAKY